MLNDTNKTILLIFQPWKTFKGSLHEMLVDALKTLPIQVDYLNMEITEKFSNQYWPDKIRNIYERIMRNNTQYYLIAENNFYNRFFMKQLNKQSRRRKYYDYVLIIKPEEYSPEFIKKASLMGKKTVGYIWDGLRLHLEPNIGKSRRYLDHLYSFDSQNIQNFPALKMEFCTNFFTPQQDILPYSNRKTDLYYIGDVGGRHREQRRDLKLKHFLEHLPLDMSAEISFLNLLHLTDNEKVQHPKIRYINEPVPMKQTLEQVKNTKAVIDICKSHHIGLSFRFFECMATETKIITNNTDVFHYDFYHPDNIWIVDFDKDTPTCQEFEAFLKLPYRKTEKNILYKYSVENWFRYMFKITPYQKISKRKQA